MPGRPGARHQGPSVRGSRQGPRSTGPRTTSRFDFACNGHPADEIEFGGGNGVNTVTTPKTVSDYGVVAYPSVLSAFDVTASGRCGGGCTE